MENEHEPGADPIQSLLDEVTTRRAEEERWEAVKNQTRADTKITHIDRRPDALVLATHIVRCDTCHSEYTYPGSHLMLRYGKSMTKHSPNDMTVGLPREIRAVEYTVAVCEKCFDAADLLQEPVGPAPNEIVEKGEEKDETA